MVALTFDDGPNGTATPKILDTLERYNVWWNSLQRIINRQILSG